MEPIISDLATNITSINLVKIPDDAASDKAQSGGSALTYAVLVDSVEILVTAAQEIRAQGLEVNSQTYLETIQKVACTIKIDRDSVK